MFRIAPCHVNRDVYLQVVGPLLHERDLYLAWSLKRSKAVNGEHQWGKRYKLRYSLIIVYVCAYCVVLLSIPCGLPQATTSSQSIWPKYRILTADAAGCFKPGFMQGQRA